MSRQSRMDELRNPQRDLKGMSARRAAAADVLGAGSEYSRAPHQVRPDQVVVNPRNPRIDLDPEGLQELADSLQELGQVQPATVMTRTAYVTSIPEDEPKLGTAEYVVISGSRRLMAAQKAKLDTFLIYVHDALNSRESILAYALVENIQRRDLSALDEAQAVRDLVDTFQNQAKVAELLGKSRGWVPQRLNLLKLTPELQAKLVSGELPVRDGRSLGSKPAEEQAQEWERRKERAREAKRPVEPPAPKDEPIDSSPSEAANQDEARPPEPEPTPVLHKGTDSLQEKAARVGGPGEQLTLDLQWEPRTMAERLRDELGAEKFGQLMEAGLELTG